MDQALVGVPALLPHGLQLVLVAVCWNGRGKGLVTGQGCCSKFGWGFEGEVFIG